MFNIWQKMSALSSNRCVLSKLSDVQCELCSDRLMLLMAVLLKKSGPSLQWHYYINTSQSDSGGHLYDLLSGQERLFMREFALM